MSASRSMPQSSPAHQEAMNLKNKLDYVVNKMNKDTKYIPKQSDIDMLSTEIANIHIKYGEKIAKHEQYLKTAILDLTEIPTMHPQMQRIAVLTAFRDASENVEKFLKKI